MRLKIKPEPEEVVENSYLKLNVEMYGGAIYSSLERDDYMPLPNLKDFNEEYQLKISNELQERQYTNLAELVVIQHPENSSVIIDKNGTIQTIISPFSPSKAIRVAS